MQKQRKKDSRSRKGFISDKKESVKEINRYSRNIT